jgi:hypothetical protein
VATDGGEGFASLERVGAMLGSAERGLQDAKAPPWVLDAVRPLPEMIHQAAGLLRDRAAAGDPIAPEILTAWRHDLRARANAVTGWAQLYVLARQDGFRFRALGMIERSAVALRTFLSTPP